MATLRSLLASLGSPGAAANARAALDRRAAAERAADEAVARLAARAPRARDARCAA